MTVLKRMQKHLIGVLFFLGTTLLLSAGNLFRMHPNSPMMYFKMPMFDNNGVKIWQCFGEKARYLSDNDIDIEIMRIEWFSPTDSNKVDMVVRSSHAKLSLAKHTAKGEGLLTIQNVGDTILGEDWIWEGRHDDKNISKIFIKKDAHVTFFD